MSVFNPHEEETTREIAIIGNYPELDEYPTIFFFSVPSTYERAEIINLFEIGMEVAKSQSENEIIGMGLTAAEYVCGYTGGTVKYRRCNITK